MLSLGPLFLAALAPPAGAIDNPLALARNGNVQCYEPNDEKKTCRTIASYRALDERSYMSIVTVLVSPEGSLTLQTASQVEVKNGAICGVVRAEDIASGRLQLAGQTLTGEHATSLMAQIQNALKGLVDKEVCTSFVKTPAGLVSKETVNGVYRADADAPVKWIGPDEGYTVAP